MLSLPLSPRFTARRQSSHRTKIAVIASLVIAGFVAGLAIFFIYPRPLDFSIPWPKPDLWPTKLYINETEERVDFTVKNRWVLKNNNWYFVTVTSFNVRAYLDRLVAEVVNLTQVSVPARSEIVLYQSVDITFKDDAAYLVKFCNDPRPWVHSIYLRFQATAMVTKMGVSSTLIADSFQRTSCGRSPTTTVAPVVSPPG